MPDTPTPAQRVALEEIRDGKVSRYFPLRLGYRATSAPTFRNPQHGRLKSRQDVLERVVLAKFARVLPCESGRMWAPVELTDAGREALAWRS